MKLFESAYNDGYEYFERYFDTDKQESFVQKIQTKQEYYMEDSKGLYTYLLDPSIKLSKRYGRAESLSYGKNAPDVIHIRDNYWKIDGSLYNESPRKWYIDIETTAKNEINVVEVREEVVLVQIYDTTSETMILLGSRDWKGQSEYKYDFECKYINCQNEIQLFETFFKLIQRAKPLIVTGWNTSGFDFPYLFNRSKKLGFDTNRFSPFNKAKMVERRNDKGQVFYNIEADGVVYVDYMDIYKKYTFIPREAYSLDHIAFVELGERKVIHDMYSTFDGFRTGESYVFPDKEPKDDYDKKMYHLQMKFRETKSPEIKQEISELANDLFVHYGCKDTHILKLLDDKLRLTHILISIAKKMGVNIKDSMGTVKPWSSFINNVSYLENKILPNLEVDEQADVSIRGGYIEEPVKGKHAWPCSIDINSAYPNLGMRGFNMSAETYVAPKDLPAEMRDINLAYFNNEDEVQRFELYLKNDGVFKRYTELAKEHNLALGINGAVFRKDELGIIPRLVKDIYNERKLKKKEMLQWKQKAENFEKELIKRGVKYK